MRRRARRLRAPLGVAAARLRSRRGSAALVVVGVAASVAVIAGSFAASLAMRDEVAQRALAALPAGDRSFRVDAFGLAPGQRYDAVNRRVTAALAHVEPGTPLRGEFLHRLRIGRGLVQLAGVDEPARAFRLRSGRWPRACTARRCEVVAIGGSGTPVRGIPGLRLVRVGVAVPGPTPFGESLASGGGALAALVARGATALDGLAALGGIYRAYSWVDPVEPRRLHVWDVSRILARETQAQDALAPLGDTFRLSGPDDALVAARDRGDVGAQRLVLLGGELAALLLGFALVAAVGLRTGLAAERGRLLARGASPLQVTVAAAGELAAITGAGAIVGTVVGASVAAATVGGDVLAHSLWTPAAVGALAGGWLVATAAAVAVSRTEPDSARRRVRPLDVAALGAVAAISLALARGGVSASASGGDATLLLLLPPLVLFASAVAAARLLGPLARAGERLARRGPLAPRLALVGIARAPARTLAAFAFLLVSVALAIFTVGYRATLDRSAADEASFTVPLDFTVAEGDQLVEPLQAAPLARFDAIGPGARAYPVVRQTADVPGPGTTTLSPTVLGVPPTALARLHWRPDFAAASADELARRLAERGPASLRAAIVPQGVRTFSLRVRVSGAPVALRLVGLDAAGDAVAAGLGERPAGTWTLVTRRPRGLRRLVGLEFSLASAEQTSIAHRAAEGEVSQTSTGSLRLAPLRADGRILTSWDGWLARGAAVAGRTPLRLDYSFGVGGTALLRPRQPTDGTPLPVVASTSVARAAGRGGRLVLDFEQTRVPARVVAVAARFPAAGDTGDAFVVADEQRLATALDADAPGLGAAGELWLAAPPGAGRALARPPFASLAVSSRRQLVRALRTDPLAHALALMLGVAAAVALALAVLGFWVAAAGELRDDARMLFDLEAQGVGPAELRRQLRIRAALVVALGILGGLAVGVALSHAAVALVRISAVGESPHPPLRFAGGWVLVAVGAAGFALACAAALELTARRFLRGEAPPRASWSVG